MPPQLIHKQKQGKKCLCWLYRCGWSLWIKRLAHAYQKIASGSQCAPGTRCSVDETGINALCSAVLWISAGLLWRCTQNYPQIAGARQQNADGCAAQLTICRLSGWRRAEHGWPLRCQARRWALRTLHPPIGAMSAVCGLLCRGFLCSKPWPVLRPRVGAGMASSAPKSSSVNGWADPITGIATVVRRRRRP